MPAVFEEVSTLIKQTLGEQVKHPTRTIECMSMLETAAEKWVALTRRVVSNERGGEHKKQALVRHIYDLYVMTKCMVLGDNFMNLVASIAHEDRKHYRGHSEFYFNEPIKAIKQSLKDLRENNEWSESWRRFTETMVYGEVPSYDDALNALEQLSKRALLGLIRDFKK